MNPILYIFKYVNLRNERGHRLVLRNKSFIIVLSAILSAPFIVIRSTNYFADHGFLDRVGGFCATLTGFYIAGLAAVATFVSQSSDLDAPIEIGQVIDRQSNGEKVALTRREYVCSLFGYLAVLSLIVSVTSSFLSVALPPIKDLVKLIFEKGDIAFWLIFTVSSCSKLIANMTFVHLMTTTCHGLYYLVDRLYVKAPKLLPMDVNQLRGGRPAVDDDPESDERQGTSH